MHHPFIVSNLSLDGKLPHNESQIPKSPQLHIQDSVSSHTVSTALQSYDAQSHNTNQTQERYISRTPEKDRRRHTPILENEEYYEKPKVNSPYGIMSDSPGTKTERLMPPKISKEPEIHYEPNKSHPRRLESSNQLNDYVGRSSGHASVSHSVEYIPSPRQIDSSERPQGFRHSHDGVLSRNKRSLSHLAMITNQSVNSIRRSIDNESRSNNSLQRDLLQTYNSIDSVNGSILSLSLSSVGSSQRYRQASLDTSYSDHPLFSPQRASKFSTSSTISSLSPQSPDHHHKTNPTISSAPVLWTQRTPKQFVKNNSNQQNAKLSFCYSSPQGDVLAISSIGDVVYCTYLPDCTGRLRPCRLCVRSSQPLILSLGKVNHEMCQNIKSLTLKYGNQNYSSSDELLKQEGIYSSKSRISDDKICIFDDILWIKQYRITELDGRLKKVYYRVYDMIQMTKKRIPKLILYLTDTPRQVPLPGMRVHSSTNSALAAESDSTNNSVVCKCMLMSNVPFPDFYVRWSDGVKLHYSLSSGRLIVNRIMKESNENLTTSREIYRWDQQGMIDGTDWTISAPEDIKIYLLQAQKAMKRCILEEYGWNSNLTEPKVIIEDIENLR